MLLKGKNNASGQLYEALSGGSATCKITSGHTFTGIEFPFNMTIYDLDTNGNPINYEIVQVSSITPNTGYDTFAITRAQEGTSDVGHLIGKRCANLITYAIIDGINDEFATVTSSLAEKANKAQEAWVTPTLLNGWVQDHPVGYIKDNFGFVRFKGAVKSGTSNTLAFVLPVGYRPSQLTLIPINASGNYGYASILTTGEVYIVGTTTDGCFIDSLTFKAV